MYEIENKVCSFFIKVIKCSILNIQINILMTRYLKIFLFYLIFVLYTKYVLYNNKTFYS